MNAFSSGRLAFGMPFLIETPDVAGAAALCRELGLQFVELNSNFPPCLIERLAALPLREIAAEYDIFFTLHVDDRFDPFDFNLKVREAYRQTMTRAIGLAREAGMPVINMHIPRGNIVTLPSGPRYLYDEYPDDFSEAVRQFRALCQEAAAGGVRIAIENTEAWAPYELCAIEALLKSPAFGLCLDIGHDHAAGNSDLTFFERHGDRLIHMHAHDGRGKVNHQALGTGEIPLEERLGMALEARATVVLEVKTAEALKTSAGYLRERGWLAR